jgi:hypothetical protein
MYTSYNNEPQKTKSLFLKKDRIGIEQEFKSDLAFAYLEYSKFLKK